MKDIQDFAGLFARHGTSWWTLAVSPVAIFLLLALVPEFAWGGPRFYWVTFAVVQVVAAAVWAVSRWSLLAKNELRLALAIYCDKEDQREEIEEDFLKELGKILQAGDLGKRVTIIKISSGESASLQSDADILSLSERKRAHLLLYGRIRTRDESGGQVHTIELRAVVRHAKLNQQAQISFAKDISEVFPSETIRIPKSDQLPHFKITAEWVGFSSRYIISLAAASVGDLDYAEKILADAERLLARLPEGVRKQRSLEERLRARMFEVAVLQSHRSHLLWRRDRDILHAEAIKERLEFARTKGRISPPHWHMMAQAIFITDRDVKRARDIISRAQFDHPVFHLNVAFISAADGDYKRSRRAYKAAVKARPDTDAIEQVLTFFVWLRADFPEMATTCDFCESILRLTIDKGDPVGAALGQRLLKQSSVSEEGLLSIRELLGSKAE